VVEMNAWVRTVVAALAGLLLLPVAPAVAAKRPRPTDVPNAPMAIAPSELQLYNDYSTPEQTYSSRSAVVHYVVLGIDAPPLNDDDLDGVPDYVEHVGEAADRALGYYERRGFRVPLADTAGPDARPDLYVSRFSPGTLGVAFPSDRAQGGAFVAIANNLDPSAERSFASVYATVAHELFHVVQFAYFLGKDPPLPSWILEGTAAALERRVNTELDDLVATIQLRRWFSATNRGLSGQSYGAQLFWAYFDRREPALLPALLTRLARRPVAGEGERAVSATYSRVSGRPFAPAFHRFALATVAEHADEIEPAAVVRRGTTYRAGAAPLSIHYVRAALRARSLTVTFPRGRYGAAATLTYELESDIAGEAPQVGRIAPRVRDGGRSLTFDVPAELRRNSRFANPALVVSNGGVSRIGYVVSAR
jgi:hypothetical protein